MAGDPNAPGSPLAGQEALTDDDARAILSRMRDNRVGAQGKAIRRQRRALERALELFAQAGAIRIGIRHVADLATATAALEAIVEEGEEAARVRPSDAFDRGAREARLTSAVSARAALRAIRKDPTP